MKPNDRIIVPLDTSNLAQATELVQELSPFVGGFKVGYELGFSVGWDTAATMVQEAGGRLFLDAKLNDIPNTVAHGAAAFAKYAPQFLTVHATAGPEALKSVIAASSEQTLVLAVTILTSISDENALAIFGASARERVVSLAKMASDVGIRGVVCSPKELLALKDAQIENMKFVTPGIRPSWASANDQARITTPAQAVRDGADYLVIGRPITAPPAEIGSPAQAAQAICEELS